MDESDKLIDDMLSPYMKPKRPPDFHENKAMKMMEKMGYKHGTGLGKNNQGRTEIVEASLKSNRLGLGFESFTSEQLEWDFDQEEIEVKEQLCWISSPNNYDIGSDLDCTWVEIGDKTNEIEKVSKYCDQTLLKDVLKAKELLQYIETLELCKARSRANPFETIRNVFFLNRAALKMANIDAACNFLFTNLDKDPRHSTNGQPYYFADVCAGPGGFSEYILWRKKWFYKGFGFTLRGEHDFQLNNFYAASTENFQALYGIQDDGNVYDPDNLVDFTEKVLQQTDGLGVHFMMSDGGFSVDGNEAWQEVLSKQIYLCQCLLALSIVRTNGHFVTKVFDLFTPFSVGLLYLMYCCFESVAILKPNASRPANSERYLICKYKRSNTREVQEYLQDVNERLWDMGFYSQCDIVTIVPEKFFTNDKKFITYILKSNNKICKRQIVSLMKVIAFSRDQNLRESRQYDLRNECLKYWDIPNKNRAPPLNITPNELLLTFLESNDFLSLNIKKIKSEKEFQQKIGNFSDWKVSFLVSEKEDTIKFYLSCGGSIVYVFKQKSWVLSTMNIELPRGTLVLAEDVTEYETQLDGKIQGVACLHIIDAYRLGDVNVFEFPYEKRVELLSVFCQALHRPHQRNLVRIQPKPTYAFEQFNKITPPVKIKQKKHYRYALSACQFDDIVKYENKPRYYFVKSMLFREFSNAKGMVNAIGGFLKCNLRFDEEVDGLLWSAFIKK